MLFTTIVAAAVANGSDGTTGSPSRHESATLQQVATASATPFDMRMPIGAGRFADCVRKVRSDAVHEARLHRLVGPAVGLPPFEKMAYVQRAVTDRIQWRSDATEYGLHDYWASAAETLAHGAGDSEDLAILKLQALRALGFHNADLFLTLARDRVAGPIAVTIARLDGHYFILDETGGPPYRLSTRRLEFEPVLTFGYYGAWAHLSTPKLATAAAPARSGLAQ